MRGASARTPFVLNINYNAKGQRTLVRYANGTVTIYDYDPLTSRLSSLKTTRPAGQNGFAALFATPTVLQDLHYTYDPIGNITRIEDLALKTVFHDQQTVAPVCNYVYDATYRLVQATGTRAYWPDSVCLRRAGQSPRSSVRGPGGSSQRFAGAPKLYGAL